MFSAFRLPATGNAMHLVLAPQGNQSTGRCCVGWFCFVVLLCNGRFHGVMVPGSVQPCHAWCSNNTQSSSSSTVSAVTAPDCEALEQKNKQVCLCWDLA